MTDRRAQLLTMQINYHFIIEDNSGGECYFKEGQNVPFAPLENIDDHKFNFVSKLLKLTKLNFISKFLRCKVMYNDFC